MLVSKTVEQHPLITISVVPLLASFLPLVAIVCRGVFSPHHAVEAKKRIWLMSGSFI